MSEMSEKTPNTLVLEQKTTTAEQDLSAHNETLSDAQIQEIVENFLVSFDDEKADLSYKEIAQVFLDAHNDSVKELQEEKRGLILEALVENPAEAFKNEFVQLERLYENRTVKSDTDMLGSRTSEFCTADHDKQRADYVFRHSTGKTGREKLEVTKVYEDKFGSRDLVTVSLMDDEFHVVKQAYKRGENYNVELEGEDREEILAKLFYDTITASALQMERSADEREENDRLALGYLGVVKRNNNVQY